jgi:hypothetical protein
MRRLVPWVLLGLVGLATAAAAALGAAGAPAAPVVTPAQWVAAVLATTAQAGTAHFSYSHVTASPNPDLRGSLSGSGVVDFSQGNVSVTEVDHQIEFEGGPTGLTRPVPTTTNDEEIVIGGVMYSRLSPDAFGAQITEADFPFTKVSVPRQPRAELGLSFALDASAGLGDLEGIEPVVAVHDLGPSTVDGQATTRYLVQNAPVHACPPVRKTAVVTTEAPSVIWVDGRGRLVQARSSSRFNGVLPAAARKLPGFAQFPTGPSATTDTLTFSSFGAPVHITPPPRGEMELEQRSSTGSASFRIVAHPCNSK